MGRNELTLDGVNKNVKSRNEWYKRQRGAYSAAAQENRRPNTANSLRVR